MTDREPGVAPGAEPGATGLAGPAAPVNAQAGALEDTLARRTALLDTSHGLLVEAGAGSGKTAILAGRVALLLASGVAPRNVAAITFTELAAAELAARVREYVDELADGRVPAPLEAAFAQDGAGLHEEAVTGDVGAAAGPGSAGAVALAPTAEQRTNLRAARDRLDELTSTTIHGFAGELTRPYPVEAGLDPGATVMDAAEADALFSAVFDAWLRRRLGAGAGAEGGGADPFVRLLTRPGAPGPQTLKKLANLLRSQPATRLPVVDLAAPTQAFSAAVERFCALIDAEPAAPDTALARQANVRAYAQRVAAAGHAADVACACLEVEEEPLFTAKRTVKVLQVKGAWVNALKARGLPNLAAEDSLTALTEAYGALIATIGALMGAASDHLAALLLLELRETVAEYAAAKRQRAVTDFDDLIADAARLLRERDDVRRELAERYRYVLVDEFQDTDPLQAEIVWRLTGEPNGTDWRAWPSRPGARFVVGDPNQSIYRFRGADPATYAALKEGLAQDPGSLTVALTTNFRSVPDVLANANLSFAAPLSADGQAGYTALAARRPGAARAALVRLPVPLDTERPDPGHGDTESPDSELGDADDTPYMRKQRQLEAQAVADLCVRLVHGTSGLLDEPIGPSEIAMLAPGYTGLAEYERALEERGLNVASQAGKGFFRRQEVQDLVALAGALADPDNTLALGAFLRGPMIGVTDEELLDVALALAADGAKRAAEGRAGEATTMTDARLTLATDPGLIPVARVAEVVRLLSPLCARRFSTAPHAILFEAVEALEARAVLVNRHGGQAARALANLERFLQSAKAYALRGLRAFADDMWAAWSAGSTEREGHVDALEDAVTLITLHSAKGLEWRVVIPVGSMADPGGSRGPWYSRHAARPVFNVLGHPGSAGGRLIELEKAEQHAERVRLWYVAATRARDLLVVPRFGFATGAAAWCNLIAWQEEVGWVEAAPPTSGDPLRPVAAGGRQGAGPLTTEAQTPAEFAAQTALIAAATRLVERRAPSRQDDARPDDAGVSPPQRLEFTAELGARILAALDDTEAVEPDDALNVGSVRGIVLHKLLEEIINGEVEGGAVEAGDGPGDGLGSGAGDGPSYGPGGAAGPATGLSAGEHAALDALTRRAAGLLITLGDKEGVVDAAEVARLALRAWNMPEVVALRGRLAAEVQVAGTAVDPATGAEVVWSGVADAVAVDAAGKPEVVIDWKSDRAPSPETLTHYREQLRAYLHLTGAREGLLVLAARGEVLAVTDG